jgi:hypothetical protein
LPTNVGRSQDNGCVGGKQPQYRFIQREWGGSGPGDPGEAACGIQARYGSKIRLRQFFDVCGCGFRYRKISLYQPQAVIGGKDAR